MADDAEMLRRRLQEAEAKLGELEEEKRQRKGRLSVAVTLLPKQWKLSGSQAELLVELASRRDGLATETQIIAALQKHGVNTRYIDAVVYQIRPKLSPFGIFIETVRGVGYRLKPESRALIRSSIAARARLTADRLTRTADSFSGDGDADQ